MTERESPVSARDLFEWNGVLPTFRIFEEEHGATPTFGIVADYGWAERIICGGCYDHDAEAILAALNEAVTRKPTYDHEWASERINENNKRERALRACIAAAGNPDAADGCRQVIGIVKEALGDDIPF